MIQLISYHFFLFLIMNRPGAINYPTPRKCVFICPLRRSSPFRNIYDYTFGDIITAWHLCVPEKDIAFICTQVHWDFYHYIVLIISTLSLSPLDSSACLSHLAVSNPTLTPLPQKTHERYHQMLKSYRLLPPHSAYYVIRFLALINVSSWEGLVYYSQFLLQQWCSLSYIMVILLFVL